MEIIDFVFSSYIYIFIIWFFFLLLAYLLAVLWSPIRNNTFRILVIVFLIFIPIFGLFMMERIGNYGYVEKISQITVADSKVCFLDQKYRNPRKQPAYFVSRLYVLDKNTGKKITRKALGVNAKILYVSGANIVFRSKSGVKIYNIQNGNMEIDSIKVNNFLLSKSTFDVPERKFSISKKGSELSYFDSISNLGWKIAIENKKLKKNSKIENSVKNKNSLFLNIENFLFYIDLKSKKIIWQKKF